MKILLMTTRLGALIFCFLIFTALNFSQDIKSNQLGNPNLSGVWILNSSSRNPNKLTEKDKELWLLVITHKEPEFIIKRVNFVAGKLQAEERAFYTDGRGETYRTEQLRPAPNRPIPLTMKSKTKWKKPDELHIETIIHVSAPSGIRRERLYEQWSLSSNGKILTRKMKYIDDNENVVVKGGEMVPSRIEEWTEIFRFVSPDEFDKLVKKQ
jgi:hypothetical protein